MEIAALGMLCAMAAWCWVTAIPAIWSGEIQTVRLIGPGRVTRDRSEQPIRYGCALLMHLYFAVTFTAGAIAVMAIVPIEQWFLGAGFATGVASLALTWHLGRPGVGSSARIVRAALSALEQVPRPAAGYRVSGKIPPSALDSALARFVRLELFKCDLACALALSAIGLSAVASMLMSSIWDWIGALLAALIGGFGVFRWRSLRRTISRAADETASSGAQRGLPEW
jgi:hypothetical protein